MVNFNLMHTQIFRLCRKSHSLLDDHRNLTEMFHSTVIAQMVPLHRTKGLSEHKVRTIFKPHLLNNRSKFNIISQKCSSQCPRLNCTDGLAAPNKWAARALDKKYLLTISTEPFVEIQNNLTEVLLMIPSTKFAQMVPHRQTKGPPGLLIRNVFSRNFLLNYRSKFTIISQKFSFCQNCTNGSTPTPLNKGTARALDKKYL